MKEAPLVSICILSYNFEDYIEECINSVLIQEVSFPYEILVFDDHSSDSTTKIIQALQNRYPNLISLHRQHNNVGCNRNSYDMILAARGKYIAWLEGDDYWIDQNKLQRNIDALEANSQFSAVHTSWRDYDEATGATKDVCQAPEDWEYSMSGTEYVLKLITGERCGCRFSSLVFRRDAVVSYLKTDPDILTRIPHRAPDFALFYILSLTGSFCHQKEVTTVYRLRNESVSRTRDPIKRYKNEKGFFLLIVHILAKAHIPADAANKKIRQILNSVLRYTFYHHLEEDAKLYVHLARGIGYRLPIALHLLYLGSCSSILHLFLKPIFFLNYFIREKHGTFAAK